MLFRNLDEVHPKGQAPRTNSKDGGTRANSARLHDLEAPHLVESAGSERVENSTGAGNADA